MDLEQVVARLRGTRPPLAENLVLLACATSTQDVARHVLSAVASDVVLPDVLVVAFEQTSGRGRDSRPWWSPPGGGLFASLIRRLDSREQVSILPLAAAVGLCEAVREAGVRQCQLKWPNDLVVGGRKIGGILIEVVGRSSGPAHAVIGFGVNLDIEREKLNELTATSLASEVDAPPDLADLVIASTRALRRRLDRLDNPAEVVQRYRELVVHRRGDRILFRQGREIIEGDFRRIDDAGFLELETEKGSRLMTAGEIVAR